MNKSSLGTGGLIIISGPSGVGKGTIIRHLLRNDPTLSLAISATTRKPRLGEAEGIDYYFLSPSEFDQKIRENAFLEWCEVHNNRYGTLVSEVNRIRDSGRHVILEIDVQGADKVMASVPDAVRIFIAPPSMDILEERLRGRGTENEETTRKRVEVAQKELAQKEQYSTIIINDSIEEAVSEVQKYIHQQTQRKKTV